MLFFMTFISEIEKGYREEVLITDWYQERQEREADLEAAGIFLGILIFLIGIPLGIFFRRWNIETNKRKRKVLEEKEEKHKLEIMRKDEKRNKTRLLIQEETAEIFKRFCREAIYKHRFALLADRKKYLVKDSYGRVKDKGWEFIDYRGPKDEDKVSVIESFITDFIEDEIDELQEIINLYRNFPRNGDDSNIDIDDSYRGIFSWACCCFDGTYGTGWNWVVDQINSVCDELENKNAKFGDSSSMDGVQYEQFCKKILEDAGWVVEDTPATGDQGVDLIASIEDLRVCIQCKCFAKPVGNKAVQEVAAGIIHWNGTHAVVVAKSGFTKSAKSLAASTKVILTSDSELENLENLTL